MRGRVTAGPLGVLQPPKAGAVVMRLYPERASRLYVLVHVWSTRRAFTARSKGLGHGSNRDAHGMVTPTERWSYRNRKRGRKDPICAEVNLLRAHLDMETVTHEFFHATAAWGRRVRFPWADLGDPNGVNAREERMAYVHGRMCAQFVVRARKAGLLG